MPAKPKTVTITIPLEDARRVVKRQKWGCIEFCSWVPGDAAKAAAHILNAVRVTEEEVKRGK